MGEGVKVGVVERGRERRQRGGFDIASAHYVDSFLAAVDDALADTNLLSPCKAAVTQPAEGGLSRFKI